MNRYKLVPTGPRIQNHGRLAQILPFIRAAAHEWSPAKLTGYIQSGEVPEDYVTTVVDHVKADPALVLVQKDDFLAAIAQEYPELHPILTSSEGNAWLERCLSEIGKGVFSSALNFLRGG